MIRSETVHDKAEVKVHRWVIGKDEVGSPLACEVYTPVSAQVIMGGGEILLEGSIDGKDWEMVGKFLTNSIEEVTYKCLYYRPRARGAVLVPAEVYLMVRR